MKTGPLSKDHSLLLSWYRANRRDLPWRRNRDPYQIWVSEVMLQQTTVAAVVPYYEKFLTLFPRVEDLAQAPENAVLKAWAGLGYYSRARNLHKAAKALAEKGFPKAAAELIEYPGFGPYTSAAVASIAFGDRVGVLDGNVIRVLCRRFGLDVDWWTTTAKKDLQARADAFAQLGQPDEINQALMELGATICTPQSPACLLCPWTSRCEARRADQVRSLPRPKPRKKIEIWTWSPVVFRKKNQVALLQRHDTPVLRGQWLFPGDFEQVKKKPSSFHARHGITHHDLYVNVSTSSRLPRDPSFQWVDLDKVVEINPSKLLQKILDAAKGLKP
ncbi:MAG TPA: A/G-specific adenine glycosylase [Pseudobdellovibrionaceae bacterium]|nr:A/G-specific adenine glycosylase [Pseudobdellovibrionaceae bacterium]